MIQVSITKAGAVTNQAQFPTQAEVDAWLAQEEANGSFGLPQRTLTGFIQTNQAGVASEAVVDVDGSIPDLTKALSTGTTTDIAGNTVHTYVMPAQYTVTATDITAQIATQATVAAAQAYLASTDWQAIRLAETGIPMDSAVKAQRQAARITINPNGVAATAAKA